MTLRLEIGKTTSSIYLIVKLGERRGIIYHIGYRQLINIYWNKTTVKIYKHEYWKQTTVR